MFHQCLLVLLSDTLYQFENHFFKLRPTYWRAPSRYKPNKQNIWVTWCGRLAQILLSFYSIAPSRYAPLSSHQTDADSTHQHTQIRLRYTRVVLQHHRHNTQSNPRKPKFAHCKWTNLHVKSKCIVSLSLLFDFWTKVYDTQYTFTRRTAT